MPNTLQTAAVAIALVATPGIALAQPAPPPPFSATLSLTDSELNNVRGGYAPLRTGLTVSNMRAIIDARANSDLITTRQISGVIFDNWFNDVGAQLIVTNVTTPR